MTSMDSIDLSGKRCLSEGEPLKVLLVEDNEDDYVLIREMLRDVYAHGLHLDWVKTYEAAIEDVCRLAHHVYLLDYRLGDAGRHRVVARGHVEGMQRSVHIPDRPRCVRSGR